MKNKLKDYIISLVGIIGFISIFLGVSTEETSGVSGLTNIMIYGGLAVMIIAFIYVMCFMED